MSMEELLLRITLSFFVLFILTRIMGRKEISQMTFFNFVSAIAIGSLTANTVLSPNVKITYGLIALAGWAVFTLLMDFIDIKSRKVRELIEGQPLIVVKDGQIMEDVLRKSRLNVDTLNAMLRDKNVFSLADVEYAIFETDGKLSVMKKDNKQFVTKGDLNIQKIKQPIFPIPTVVVSDGNIVQENLSKLNLEENWLEQQLNKAGVQDISDVFYAEIQQNGSLYIDKRDDVLH